MKVVIALNNLTTKVVQGWPVKIGVLDGVFAATQDVFSCFDDFVITHIVTGLAVPCSRGRTVAEAVIAAERKILEIGEERYREVVLKAIAEWGPLTANAYADIALAERAK